MFVAKCVVLIYGNVEKEKIYQDITHST